MAHMTKHELKHDEMIDFGEKLADWYHNNDKLITAVLLVILIAIIGWKGYGKYSDYKHAKSSQEYEKVLTQYNMALQETDASKRKEALTAAASEADRVAKEYSGYYVGRAAQLMRGNALFVDSMVTTGPDSLKYLNDAQVAFQSYKQMAKTPQETAVANLAIGNALENALAFSKNDMNKAKEADDAYAQVEKDVPGTYLAAEAKLARARLAQVQTNQEDKARKLYEEVAKERKIAEPAKASEEKTFKDERGHEMTAKELNDIRQFADSSYAAIAKKQMNALKGEATATK